MSRRIVIRAVLICLLVAVAFLFAIVGKAYADVTSSSDVIPDQTYISGLNVSYLTADEATDLVSSYVDSWTAGLGMSLTDPQTGATYTIDLSSGVSCDVDAAVSEATGRNGGVSLVTRVLDEVAGAEPERKDIALAYTFDDSVIQPQVEQLAAAVHVDAVDAARTFNDDNTVTLTAESAGRDLDVATTVAAAQAAVDQAVAASPTLQQLAGATITSTLTTVALEPAVTLDSMPYAVIVDYAQFMLYVFDGDRMIYSVMIGYGRGWEDGVNYSSPEGLHYIEYFDPAPTWTNPDPTGWGKDYKAYYAGGEEGNPLGSRAMKVSDAPMVFIHGVTDPNCIGNRLSHGCINVWDDDVIQLYQLLYDNAVAKGSSSVGGSGTPVYVYFHNYPG